MSNKKPNNEQAEEATREEVRRLMEKTEKAFMEAQVRVVYEELCDVLGKALEHMPLGIAANLGVSVMGEVITRRMGGDAESATALLKYHAEKVHNNYVRENNAPQVQVIRMPMADGNMSISDLLQAIMVGQKEESPEEKDEERRHEP